MWGCTYCFRKAVDKGGHDYVIAAMAEWGYIEVLATVFFHVCPVCLNGNPRMYHSTWMVILVAIL